MQSAHQLSLHQVKLAKGHQYLGKANEQNLSSACSVRQHAESQNYKLLSGRGHSACYSMPYPRAAQSGQLYMLLLVSCLLCFPCLKCRRADEETAGLMYTLPNSEEPTNVLLRPSNVTVNGTTPRTSLPQLATCGCPAAEQYGKATGSSVVAALQTLTAATSWTVDQIVFLSGQDVFHTEVGTTACLKIY